MIDGEDCAVESALATPSDSEDVATAPAIEATEDAPPDSQKLENGASPSEDVLINEEAENHKANRELRGKYADKAHLLATLCLAGWAICIVSNAAIFGFSGKLLISDTLMIAITTGVTVNVLAAFLGVIRGLFPTDQARKKNGAKKVTDKKKRHRAR